MARPDQPPGPVTDPRATLPASSAGITLAELCVIVLGAGLGAAPLGHMQPSGLDPDESLPLIAYIMLPLMGVLIVGPIILGWRLTRGVPVGPGEIVWTIAAALTLPVWIVVLVWTPGTQLRGFQLVLLDWSSTVAFWLSIALAAAGTIAAAVTWRRGHMLSWIGLALTWAWVGCLIAIGVPA